MIPEITKRQCKNSSTIVDICPFVSIKFFYASFLRFKLLVRSFRQVLAPFSDLSEGLPEVRRACSLPSFLIIQTTQMGSLNIEFNFQTTISSAKIHFFLIVRFDFLSFL